MAQLVKKKGRPPKEAHSSGIMNSNINTTHVTGNSSSSKTVAAILKQQSAKDALRGQQQQALKKKSKSGLEPIQPTNLLNQLKTTTSPLSRVGSPSLVVSPALSPSNVRGVSPLGKDPNHPATTKGSSLSRDLSPSRITAQMVKVMAETAPAQSPNNLLRSALQGSMPDPMGILSTSKTEGGIVSVVTCTSGSISTFNQSRKSPANVSSFPQNTNILSSSSNSAHTFKILTNLGSGGYISQPGIDSGEACSPILNNPSTVENLLASSDGTIQTVNVSHIPKVTISNNSNIGGLPGTTSSSISPRPSPRSAMEVAQQIKMEANGQKSSALRPGMQQQLRSQIQSSRSIDAQFAPKQNQLSSSKGQNSAQRGSPKDTESKSKDISLPLLTAKLTSSGVPAVVKVPPSATSQLKQQLQPSVEMLSLSIVASAPSSTTPASAATSTLPISTLMKKPSQFTSNTLPEIKPRFQQASHQHQPTNTQSMAMTKPSHRDLAEHSWLLQQQVVTAAESQTPPLNLSGGLGEILSGLEKGQNLERLIQASISGTMGIQTDNAIKVEGHSQTIGKNTNIFSSMHRGKSPSQISTGKPNVEKKIQDLINQQQQNISGCNLKLSSSVPAVNTGQTISKYRLGDSQQTAIDVDIDIGQLASITGENPLAKNDSSKDARRGQPALNQQLFNTHNSVVPGTVPSTLSFKGGDSQTFLPLKSSAPLTFHTLQTTTSLAQIPKPIVHATPSPSTVSSATTLRPPPDYTPPPPYPVRSNQQSLPAQSHQLFPSKSSQSVKQTMQNPFTFPTTGIKQCLDQDSLKTGFAPPATQFNSINSNNVVVSSFSKTDNGAKFREPKVTSSLAFKPQVDGLPAQHKTNILIKAEPQEVKPDVNFLNFNHVHDEKKKLIQPFNQRISNLSSFPVSNSSYRASYRSHAVAVQRARANVITSTTKSLDILRQNIQRSINKELTEIIKKYMDKYFQPALENIKLNNNEPFLGDDHINYICRQILEEAKSEYISDTGRRSVTPSDIPDNVSESGSLGGRRAFLKRSRISDSDSEKGSEPGGIRKKIAKKKGRPSFYGSSGRVTPSKPYKASEPVKREGPKWDPDRIKSETLFVMGARANKALGLGNTRGRLYIRHPDVFKYIGDQEDKLWLCEHNLMPPTGGKAYLLLWEDIEDLSKSDEYKDSPGLMMHECTGFTVPDWMLVKMKEQMNALRSDQTKRSMSRSPDTTDARPKSLPFSTFSDTVIKEETMQVSPADTEDMDFLSTADNDDTQPSSGISPFTVSGGFDDGVSPSPSDLDPIDDPAHVPNLFS